VAKARRKGAPMRHSFGRNNQVENWTRFRSLFFWSSSDFGPGPGTSRQAQARRRPSIHFIQLILSTMVAAASYYGHFFSCIFHFGLVLRVLLIKGLFFDLVEFRLRTESSGSVLFLLLPQGFGVLQLWFWYSGPTDRFPCTFLSVGNPTMDQWWETSGEISHHHQRCNKTLRLVSPRKELSPVRYVFIKIWLQKSTILISQNWQK
jgi:hypothetical protein